MPVRSVLATGEVLVGNGIRSFDSAIREILALPLREVQIASYSFDRSFIPVLKTLHSGFSGKGLKLVVITRPLEAHDPGVRPALAILQKKGVLVPARPGCGGLLHTKVLAVNRKHAVLGSANFTFGGLTANHELGVWLTGKDAWEVAKALDRLEDHLRNCR